ncbi:MAG: alpha/beta hydrolase [Elusimicrobia bacterium]|nr:alpha/beta hydrolase [Elusimicrobiota bacterium]
MKNSLDPISILRRSAAALVLISACSPKPVIVQPPPVVQPPPIVRPPRVLAPESLQKALSDAVKEPFSDTQAMDVIYATNRVPLADASACGDGSFGVERSTALYYGVCSLNVPKRHSTGGFEVAPNPRADSHKYFRVLSQTSLDEPSFKALLAAKKPTDVLVFVHGFNVKFAEAVLRASQIAYDLKFQGPVVLFTWPAGASGGMMDSALINRTYDANRMNAIYSVDRTASFFKALSELDMSVHVMVHSMGHQVVLTALAKAAPSMPKPFIGELVLNAPDIPIADFQRLAPTLKDMAERVTVYCSYNDNAIAASETYNKNRRLGGCERAPGIDVINVSEIDAPALGIGGLGHGYYAARPILTDIYQVLLGVPAEKRLFIRRSEPNSTEDYYLRP